MPINKTVLKFSAWSNLLKYIDEPNNNIQNSLVNGGKITITTNLKQNCYVLKIVEMV